MSKRIFKYMSSDKGVSDVQMRLNADILDVQLQDGVFCLWALSKDTALREQRRFRVFFTGVEIPEVIAQSLEYIGTVQYHKCGIHMAHVFEEILPVDLDKVLEDVSHS